MVNSEDPPTQTLTLGAEGQKPRGQIEIFFWSFKQFTHHKPSRQILNFFENSPPLWSQLDQWANCEYVLKEPIKMPRKCLSHSSWSFLKKAQQFDLNLPTGFSLIIPWVLCKIGLNYKKIQRKPSEQIEIKLVMKFIFLDSFLVFTFLSSLSGLIILTFFLWTTFLILIRLLTSHQERESRTDQTWD